MKKSKICIVDSDPVTGSLVHSILSSETRTIEICSIDHLEDFLNLFLDYDLFIFNDDYHINKTIRIHEKIKDFSASVMIIRADTESPEDIEIKCLDKGFDDVIISPYNKTILEARVSRTLKSKKQIEKLSIEATVDSLTGVLNRSGFETKIKHEIKRAIRSKEPLSFFLIDIDFFKLYNDYYGHIQGDMALKSFAGCLSKSVFRSSDIVGRWGGEEFVVALPKTDKEGAIAVAKRIAEQLQKLKISHKKSKISPYLTISMGISTVTLDEVDIYVDPQKILSCITKSADEGLYEAKKLGRNTYVYCVPDSSSYRQKVIL